MSVGYGDLKKGMSIEMDGEPYSVVEYERSKMQQRAPVMRIRFKNLKTGKIAVDLFNKALTEKLYYVPKKREIG